MQRRSFLKQATLASAAVLPLVHSLRAAPPVAARLTLGTTRLASVPTDFTGISIESPQLYNPDYFSASNTSLVEAFRKLSANGTLRSGGHLSDVARWKGPHGDFLDPKQVAGIEHGKTYWEWKLTDPSVRDTKDGAITPQSIQNLKAFLDATNWNLIYGLNFGSGSIARAADEAAYVSKIMGSRLIAFQLGNEDDQFGGMPIMRGRPYNFDNYYTEYLAFVAGVKAAVPSANFGGPDVASNMNWVKSFAEKRDNDAIFLSSHFYAMGPAKDPGMDAAFLLGPNTRLVHQIEQVHTAMAASNNLPYRLTETNSCFGGGKPDVSNAFASSLWGADYMLQCAAAGYAGINLHGGGDGYYTAIAVGPELATELRPLYFGMRFADQFTGADLFECKLDCLANATAYHGKRGKQTMVAIINKSESAINVTFTGNPEKKHAPTELRLTAPSLDAKTGILLTPSVPMHADVLTVPAFTGVIAKWSSV